MFRAQAVLLASACLALAPAAFAETHHASHKPHAKGHVEEAPSRKAKLRRTSEADATPAEGRKVHAEKAASTSKHRRAADEEADAGPSKSSKRHKRADTADAAPSKSSRHHGKSSHADEEADAAPSKSSRRHGKTAVAERAEATTSKASKRRHEEARAEEEDQADAAPRSRRERARAEEGEGSPLIRADVRSTRTCVAAHVRLHGRPHGSRARLALQRECAKEVEAARRRAEEEIAIRTWTPPHGPLIYQGALPRSTAPAAEPPTAAPPTAEPPIAAPPISALPTDPAAAAPAAPTDQTARADASTPPPSPSAPASGVATVAQAPAPQASGGIFGLFRRRGALERKPGEPAPTLAELVGSDETRLKAELGEPELMRAEGDGALWTYRLPACALYVFLGRDASTSPWKVKGAQAGPLKRGEQPPEVDVCLKSGRS